MKSEALSAYAERAAAPLDNARRLWLALVLRSRTLSALLVRRERRIAALASLNVALSFLAALYFPVLLFVLGPILLGVAHVAADVRYLVLRRALERWWQNAVWVGCLGLLLVRAGEEAGLLRAAAALETGLAALFIATAVGAGLRAGGTVRRALLALSLLAGATAAAFAYPTGSRLAFLHAHNVVALVLWVYLYARRRAVVLPLLLVLAFALLLASGALSHVTFDSPGIRGLGLHALAVSDWVAPFASPDLALGMVCAYVFLQSVHYGVWLSFVPQEELGGEGSLTFRMSARSLFRDLGGAGVAAVVFTLLAVLVAALFEVHRTRSLYLSLAMFHGYLELAMLAYFFVARSRPRTAGTA